MKKTVEVKAIQIFCDNVDNDPGNELEIYGSLAARVGNLDQFGVFTPLPDTGKYLWHREDDNCIDLAQYHTHLIEENNSVVFDVSEGQAIEISGLLMEYDSTSANEELGSIREKIKYDEIPITLGPFKPRTYEFFEPGVAHYSDKQRVTATFAFKVIKVDYYIIKGH